MAPPKKKSKTNKASEVKRHSIEPATDYRSAKRMRRETDAERNKEIFPILDLPDEVSFKILSYMGKEELRVCLQSFDLDKMHANLKDDTKIPKLSIYLTEGWSAFLECERYQPDKIHTSSPRRICDRLREIYENCEIETMSIKVDSKADVSSFRELIQSCKTIRCTGLLEILIEPGNDNSSDSDFPSSLWGRSRRSLFDSVFTNKLLRDLLSNKKDVLINSLCGAIKLDGLHRIFEDLLDGDFDGLSIFVQTSVSNELFNVLLTGDKNSQFNESTLGLEEPGRVDPTERYEIWRHEILEDPIHGKRNVLRMSRIYDGRRWRGDNFPEPNPDKEPYADNLDCFYGEY